MLQNGDGHPLPDWAKVIYPQPISNLMGKGFKAHAIGTSSMTRLLIGNKRLNTINTSAHYILD